ncbi:MAG: hypothetical protein WCR53_08310 [Bacteroidaceae bacterium]
MFLLILCDALRFFCDALRHQLLLSMSKFEKHDRINSLKATVYFTVCIFTKRKLKQKADSELN